MRIVLHIGAEKTGTTAIQAYCARNAEALQRAGVLYPGGFGFRKHAALTAAVVPSWDIRARVGFFPGMSETRFKADVLARLGEAVRRTRPAALLLSSEHLSSRLEAPEQIADLRALLSGLTDEFRVVVYLRRQDDLLLSLYSTFVKSGGIGSMDLVGSMAWWFDFDRMLTLWEDGFGRESVVVQRYPPRGPSLIDDFFVAAGLPAKPVAEVGAPVNASLDHRNTMLLHAMNRRLPGFRDDRVNHERIGLAEFFERRSGGPALGLPSAVRRELLDRYIESNARVCARYFPGEEALFEPPAATEPARDEVSVEDAIDVAAEIWKEYAALSARLEAAERASAGGRVREFGRALQRRVAAFRGRAGTRRF